MSNGDDVVVKEGDYICGSCNSNGRMFWISGLYGKVRCERDNLGCKLDGEGSRQVMLVDGTGGGTLVLRGLHILRGNSVFGGGMNANSNAMVTLELVLFENCHASSEVYGGGAIMGWSGDLNLFGVSFLGNTAASNQGYDIYVNTGSSSVTFHNTCPVGEGGSPTEGES